MIKIEIQKMRKGAQRAKVRHTNNVLFQQYINSSFLIVIHNK